MSPAIPASLLRVIVAAVPTAEVPKLIAEWARTFPENAARTERIRAQVAARGARGFLRAAEPRDLTDTMPLPPNLMERPRDCPRQKRG